MPKLPRSPTMPSPILAASKGRSRQRTSRTPGHECVQNDQIEPNRLTHETGFEQSAIDPQPDLFVSNTSELGAASAAGGVGSVAASAPPHFGGAPEAASLTSFIRMRLSPSGVNDRSRKR